MIEKDKILALIRAKGPVLPIDVAKELKTSIIMASAFLSELVSNKIVQLTRAKFGGTPMYYVSGQEPKLIVLYDKLHEKEKKAYDLLKEKVVIRDTKMTPVERVAMREIRDFAKPLEVSIKGKKEIFWKWFLISNDEAVNRIKKLLGHAEKRPEQPKEKEKEVVKQQQTVKPMEERKLPEDIKEKKPEHKRREEKTQQEEKQDNFELKIRSYCRDNNMKVISSKIIKKNSEVEMVVIVGSSVGDLTFYLKAKKKKRCNDADLSSAFIQGQAKKLPVLFITTGDFTKKAKEMLQSEFRGIKTKKI